MPKAKRELDAYTLRAVADEIAEAVAQYDDMARKLADKDPGTSGVFADRVAMLRGVVMRLRGRATRVEKRRGRA